MIKWTTFATVTSEGRSLIRILNEDLEKTAEYIPEVQSFIANFEKKANHTYVLVNAMTSGEHFGPNLNGDYFPEAQLQTYHKTFEKHAYAYRHHVNKDPQKSAGKVIFASYNPGMHRVELVIELDNSKAQDIIDRLNRGELPAVSMGTRTPSDRCSICNHRAKNTASYCDHLKYQMRRTLDDGRRIYAVNDDRLTFFDISFVRVPADKTASVITKVAHVHDEDVKEIVISSARIGEEWLKQAGIKEADLFKEVPGTIEGMSPDPKGLILETQKRIPKSELDKIANEFSLKDILSTMLGLRIMPRPDEFVRLVCMCSKNPTVIERANAVLGHEHLLIDVGEGPLIPADVSIKGFNDDVAARMYGWVPGMSLTKPLIMQRIIEKHAAALLPTNEGDRFNSGKQYEQVKPFIGMDAPKGSLFNPVKNPIIPLAGVGGLWYGFQKIFNNSIVASEFSKLMLQKGHEWMLPAFLGAVAVGTSQIQKRMFSKEAALFSQFKDPNFPVRAAIGIPVSYIAAGHVENKLQQGKPITKIENLVRKHPFITGMLGLTGAQALKEHWPDIKGVITKHASWDRIFYGLNPDKFEELYNDIIENTNPLDTN